MNARRSISALKTTTRLPCSVQQVAPPSGSAPPRSAPGPSGARRRHRRPRIESGRPRAPAGSERTGLPNVRAGSSRRRLDAPGSTSGWSPADDCRGRLGPEPLGHGRAWRALSYPNKHHVGQLGFRLPAAAHKEPEWVTARGLVPPTRMCWPSSWLWLWASHCPIPRLMMSCIVGWYPSAMMNSVSRIHPRSPADEPIRLSSEHRPTRGSKCARS